MNRLPSQPTPAFGLVAWLEETKIALPLKGVECRFDVTAGVASVEIDQIFHQNSTRPLDCTYTFPLGATVGWRPSGCRDRRLYRQADGAFSSGGRRMGSEHP